VPPDDAELARILDLAAPRVRWLDTACAYGDVPQRLAAVRAWERFRIVTKVSRAAGPADALACHAAVVLAHLRPDESGDGYPDPAAAAPRGVSVYTVAQAQAALDAGCAVLQAPWNRRTVDAAWVAVRDRAYADGVLFFGRQPFARGRDVTRDAWRWALTTNPRGWCVVGVETAAQLAMLLTWRNACA
jgi:hypothetical protein